MKINPDFVSPCGLYCGVCAIYMAHRDNNLKFKERLLELYKGKIPGRGVLPRLVSVKAARAAPSSPASRKTSSLSSHRSWSGVWAEPGGAAKARIIMAGSVVRMAALWHSAARRVSQ